MASRFTRLKEVILHRRALARWRGAALTAEDAELGQLRQQRQQARALRAQLDRLIHVADGRLALPRIGSNTFARPGGTLWSWRPQLWRGPLPEKGRTALGNKTALGDEVALFHDCKISELTMRQVRNTQDRDLAPFGLRLDVFRFDGSFLSLVIELPQGAVEGLQKRHVIQLDAMVDVEKPIEIFARLNIKHGPNTEQVVQEFPRGEPEAVVAFDLAYTDLNEKRVEKAWVDLIFEGPEMNQVTLRDVTFCRYPRAEL